MNFVRQSLRLFLVVAALAAAACGGGGGGSSSSKSAASPTAAAQAFPAGSTMAQIVSKGAITIGVKYDVPLMGLFDHVKQQVDGFDIAVGKEIAKDMGLKENQVKFVEAVTANRIPFLQEDKSDLVISTFTITDERKQ